MKIRRFFAAFLVLAMLCIGAFGASAYDYEALPEGTYPIKATLSCYVNAMGGVEFGAPLLTSAVVEVSAEGSKTMTLYFTKSQVTIYGITCDTFIDISPSYVTETNGVLSGTLGYYNAEGTLITDTLLYTLSDDTAENARKEQVHYVASVSFPIESKSDTYTLSLFVNSNVMGTQFTKDGYAATLTVDWSSLSSDGSWNEEPEPSGGATEEETPPSNTGNVENKDGLNIYPAEKDTEPAPKSDQTASGGYVAYFREPVLIAVVAVAGIFIACGAVLLLLGRKERKK